MSKKQRGRPLKYVDTSNVKILSSRKRAKELYQRKKHQDLSDVAKRIISEHKQLGIKSIESKLRQSSESYMRKGIRDYLRKEHNMIKQTPGMVDKH